MILANAPAILSQDSFAIKFAPLDVAEVYALADSSANGAVVLMSGMVRNQTEGHPVIALDYQAYEPMALQVFQQMAGEVRERWEDVQRVVIHHRVGYLEVGEISVLIAVGCPHRASAFAACQYIIDTLKERAPIWKKEFFSDREPSWVKCC